MLIKEIDVLDVQELIWSVPMKFVSKDQIIEELQRDNGNYRFISIEEDHDYGEYLVNLSVVSAFNFETIKELITDFQYKLGYLFDKFTIQNSIIVPFVDGEIYDYIF
ncbi:hypothetical protein [Sporosarcina sp. FSL K6-5500]|uniref:hypothetical protein n=1 Tax=Sporosarcina sp. FSL K6-5500 TaxID=2921558 RepID=UPI0030FA04CE